MNFFYKTLNYQSNPNAEYQRRKGVWYKRKKDSRDEWYIVPKEQSQWLEKHFESRKPIYFYNSKLFLGSAALLVLGYYIYLKRGGFGAKKK